MWNSFFSSGHYPEPYNYRSSYNASSSRSSSNLRVVNPDPGDMNAGAVCAIATVSGVSYAKAWNTALDHGFSTSRGMSYSEIKATLNELGVGSTYYDEAPRRDDLPDLAMITVRGESDELHVVIFERQSDGEEYIYDSDKSHPVGPGGYTFVRSDGYLKIGGQSSSSSSPSYYTPFFSSYYPPPFHTSSFSRSSSDLRVVQKDPGDENVCGVCAVAVVAGVSYAKAWNTAIDNGFDKSVGLSHDQIKATLEDLGVSCTYYDEAPGWDDFDDLAIITVRADGDLHAVVFERRPDGREYIYDSNRDYPVGTEGYSLVRSSPYIKINRGTGGPYA